MHPTGGMNGPEQPRVLIIAEHASEQWGGEAMLPVQYFRRLRARGIETWMLVHDRTRPELESLFPSERDRIVYVRDTWRQRLLACLESVLPERAALPLAIIPSHFITQRSARRLGRRLVRALRIDVVYEPTPVSPRVPSLLHGVGAPVVVGPLNGAMSFPPAFSFMERPWVRAVTRVSRAVAVFANLIFPGKRRAAIVLVANERTRRALPHLNGRVRYLVENGVDLTLFRERENRAGDVAGVRYVFVGRLIPLKGLDLALEALARIPAEAGIRLEIVGEGPDRPRLEAAVERLGLGERVSFAGWLSHDACAARLRGADALVMPSLRECGGAVVLEAMAVGLPVIAARWGGQADYLDDSCGLLVDPSSREAFIEGFRGAMVRLASDPQARQRMGEAARRRLIEGGLDWESKIDLMLGYFREAAGIPPNRPAQPRHPDGPAGAGVLATAGPP